MKLTQNMQSYISDLKSLSEISNFKYFDKKDDNFEKIYKKAQEKDLNLNNVKKILSSLDRNELSTIQHYKSIADTISLKSLSNEGAYNLLVHDYENIDYNGDGYTDVGSGRSVGLIPQEAPHKFREKFIEALKEMKKNGANDFEIMSATIATFGKFTFSKLDELNYNKDPGFRELLQKHGIDKFIYKAPQFDDDYIKRLKLELENPKSGEYSSGEFREGMRKFFEAFDKVLKNSDKEVTPSIEKIAFDYKASLKRNT